MLKFIDKNDYRKLTKCVQVSYDEIVWEWKEPNGTVHTGVFLRGQLSPHTRFGKPALIGNDGEIEREVLAFNPFDECQTECLRFVPLSTEQIQSNLKSLIDELCHVVDALAGTARRSFVTDSQLISEEYSVVKRHAQAWDGQGEAPYAIASWATAEGLSVPDAHAKILKMASDWEEALLFIREVRLDGKARLKVCESEEAAKDLFKAVEARLNAIRPIG